LREFNAESIKLTDTDQHEPIMKMWEFWQGKDEPIAIKTNRRDDQSTN
jgi:hypothetical protein